MRPRIELHLRAFCLGDCHMPVEFGLCQLLASLLL